VQHTGTDLSKIQTLCGGPEHGATAAAYETLKDSQTSQFLFEGIIQFDTAADAEKSIMGDRQAVDQTGSCSVTFSGVTEQYQGDNPGSPPSSCPNPEQYFATQASVPASSYSGFLVEAACGTFTITVEAQGGPGAEVDMQTADGYLSSAVGQFASTSG
jgi:hypothetical protein